MAPPPPTTSMPLQERLLNLAKTLQFAWFFGHLTLILTTLRYGLSYVLTHWYGGMARFCYRTAFVSAAFTYGIVVYKAWRSRSTKGQPNGALALLTDENVQYLFVALQWLFARQMPLALLPFTVYSVFHVATYARNNLLKAFYPPPPSGAGGSDSSSSQPKKPPGGIDKTLHDFVKNHYDSSMKLVAYLEIALWFRILGSALLFQRGSWIIILAYTVFFRARLAQSTFVRSAVAGLSARVDAALANQGTPPAAQQAWNTVKGLAVQAADATDLHKYVGGGAPGAGPKKDK